METNFTSIKTRHEIFKETRPVFKSKLGKLTHQRISGDWHFHGLGFVQGHMTYVFGFNMGFFKKDEQSAVYDTVGLNVLVRTNGYKSDLRLKFDAFFRENLKDWALQTGEYGSFRGGKGSEYSRYKKLSEFSNENGIIDFINDSITGLQKVYDAVLNNHELFKDVVRAGVPWHDTIEDLALEAKQIN